MWGGRRVGSRDRSGWWKPWLQAPRATKAQPREDAVSGGQFPSASVIPSSS